MIEWTEEDRALWQRTWDEPHMKKGLLKLKLSTVVPAESPAVAPGVDLNQLQGHSYSHAQGQSKLLEEIEKMKQIQTHKPLPPPFQAPKPKTE